MGHTVPRTGHRVDVDRCKAASTRAPRNGTPRAPPAAEEMASWKHEGIVRLFQNRPALGFELLREIVTVEEPEHAVWRGESDAVTELEARELRPDVVSVARTPEGKPVTAVVVEVQLHRDAKKRRVWPSYAASLFRRHGCPVSVLVVPGNESVARWASRSIAIGPGSSFSPIVVHPHTLPRIEDLEAVLRDPELAVLSGILRQRQPDALPSLLTTIEGLQRVDSEQVLAYHDILVGSLEQAIRGALEEAMRVGDHDYRTEFAKKHLAEGVKQGRVQRSVEDLLAVLEARGLEATAEELERIRGCSDLARLDAWLRKAAVASSVGELFE